jgi:hypothetical protein
MRNPLGRLTNMKKIYLILMLCSIKTALCQDTSHSVWKVIIPSFGLKESECIEKMEVSISCARWYSFHNVPNDWIVEASNPVSEVSVLTVEAAHGASALWHDEQLRNILFIRDTITDCFDIKVNVMISDRDRNEYRIFKVSKNQIKLKKYKLSVP